MNHIKQITGIIPALLLVPLAVLQGTGAAAPVKPNILFIMADDLGWRDLGCFGSKFHQTPNLDRLAARGVIFTQAYAANPLCSPTRSSVLTGLWPARTGITAPVCHLPQIVLEKQLAKGNPNMPVLVAASITRLKTDYVTLPKVLRDAGYCTGHFGKWHLGAEPYSPLQHGFDVDWPHWPGPGPAGSYVAPWKFPATLEVEGKPGEHIEDMVSLQVVRFIRENRDRPFYVNYWPFSVHAPYDAKDELVAKYRKLAGPNSAQRNPVYAAMVESLDGGVGRVLAALEECGVADRTIVVFFSDNGGVSWGGKGGAAEHKSARFQADMTAPPTSNLPLRNGKASLYEGGVREPCIVVWPGVTKPGTANDTVIQSIDWMPTLLDMAGVPLPRNAKPDGVSLAPLLRGGTLDRDTIFCHFPHDTPASGQHPGTSVRRGDWKLIRLHAQNEDGTDQLELYNLRDDLGETKNLAAEEPHRVRELNALITKFLADTGAVVPVRNPSYKPSAARKSAGIPSPKPNILVILADDLGYADVGFNGSKDIPTPNLDTLARSGVRCTSGYVTHPFCSPTRAGLLTGRYQQRFGHENNPAWLPQSTVAGLPLSQTTLPQVLKTAGYVTGCVGKWHLGAHPQFHPNRRGFDEYFGLLGGGHVYTPGAKGSGEYQIPMDRNGQPEPLTEYLTAVLAREGSSFITHHKGQPWFLYLAFNAPHTPLQVTDPLMERVKHITDEIRRSYAGLVVGLDDAVGVVMNALKESGQVENTLVFFLSDNGGPVSVTHSDNTPLRGAKGDVFEGGIRVPFLVSWPGRVPQGRDYVQPVISLDVFATAVALTSANVPASHTLEGTNILPYLTGRQAGAPHDRLFWRAGGGTKFAVREGDWKLVGGQNGRTQLFNLAADLGESKDLAAAQPEVLTRLSRAYDDWNKNNVAPLFESPRANRPKAAKKAK